MYSFCRLHDKWRYITTGNDDSVQVAGYSAKQLFVHSLPVVQVAQIVPIGENRDEIEVVDDGTERSLACFFTTSAR